MLLVVPEDYVLQMLGEVYITTEYKDKAQQRESSTGKDCQ